MRLLRAILETPGPWHVLVSGVVAHGRRQGTGMQVKMVNSTSGEKVYAVIFRKGDEALSGLTDFAIQYKVQDAHFTAIGEASSATLA